jgi:hypothetical protein
MRVDISSKQKTKRPLGRCPGFSLMPAQSSRAASLRTFGSVPGRAACSALASLLAAASLVIAQPWREMDYGPCLAATLEVAPDNLAYKGLAIRLDDGPGGIAMGRQFVVFDTDTLRYAAGWEGPGFIDWQNIAFDGQHGVHASIVGKVVFQNDDAPGWSRPDGSFDDQRLVGRDQRRYGRLPHTWARWQGYYVHGRRVILRYQVGSSTVLEFPRRIAHGRLIGFLRTINLGPRSRPVTIQVASASPSERIDPTSLRLGSTTLPICKLTVTSDPPNGDAVPGRVKVIGALGDVSHVKWRVDDDQVRLELPSGAKPSRLQLVYVELPPGADEATLSELFTSIPPPADLMAWTTGGPPASPGSVTTHVQPLGPQEGPLTAEEIRLPDPNPFHSWMRPSGFDFFADGDRAAACTWQGDVWVVQGLSSADGTLHWTRIASGLFQPLGLRIVDDTIYVTGRDQLTRLVDLNGDGATDYYENFNNDAQVTDHFHEFAMDLQTDAAGNFYYAKAARHALEALVPQHGTLIRVSPDGLHSEIVARGFRAPNGVCVNPDGTFLLSDQEGHWTPKNRINLVRQGGFYGNMMSWHDARSANDYEQPLCWIHNDFDRSPAQLVWTPTELGGPLGGQLLSLSYGTGEVHLVLIHRTGSTTQAGLIRLPLTPFPTGIMRARFHPDDHQLYLCGLFGWSSNQTSSGGMYRVRYHRGRSLYLPTALRVDRNQLVLDFAAPLNEASATDPGNYSISQWNYRRTPDYGSDDYRVSNPRRLGRDRVRLQSANLSADGRTLTLGMLELKPSMQLDLRYRIQAEDGTEMDHRLHQTLHTTGSPP